MVDVRRLAASLGPFSRGNRELPHIIEYKSLTGKNPSVVDFIL